MTMNQDQDRRRAEEVELPVPAYKLGSGDIPSYSDKQVREAIATIDAARSKEGV